MSDNIFLYESSHKTMVCSVFLVKIYIVRQAIIKHMDWMFLWLDEWSKRQKDGIIALQTSTYLIQNKSFVSVCDIMGKS